MTLAFTAWGFAGVIAWTVHVMLIGGALTFVAAVAPTGLTKRRPSLRRGDPQREAGWFRKLTAHHFTFLFSFAFLIYLITQAFNPSITVVHGEGGWWIEKIQTPFVQWLPTSVQSGYEPMNAFRVLEWFTASY